MPTITNPGVIRALVTAYLLKDRNKAEACLEVGYSYNYAKNGDSALLFERDDVKAEIKKQEVALLKKTGLTKEDFAYDLEEAKRLGMKINQPSAAVSAINTNMRLHGMDQVESHRETTIIIINPPSNVKKRESEVIENEM
ncbi:hypothetical protein LCGC14_1207890 [marine sediment metagenome]|uniref:Terminase small subunit n=1 Tax=marine sediment metagenome TaxID=412755 RepID=A0A0F9NXA2_9ZZZZ|nr:hypothetical protein [Actinomycetota bacterium]